LIKAANVFKYQRKYNIRQEIEEDIRLLAEGGRTIIAHYLILH